MREVKDQTWVVYSMPLKGCAEPMRAVCEQREWEAMDQAKPGFYTLIQSGIGNEGEAERLARGTSGEVRPRNAKTGLRPMPDENTEATVAGDAPAES
jgi:hypothetical protein